MYLLGRTRLHPVMVSAGRRTEIVSRKTQYSQGSRERLKLRLF